MVSIKDTLAPIAISISRQSNFMVETTKVNVSELKEKLSSKHAIYIFLTCDCNVFLDKESNVNMWFVKQLLDGEKGK